MTSEGTIVPEMDEISRNAPMVLLLDGGAGVDCCQIATSSPPISFRTASDPSIHGSYGTTFGFAIS